MGGAASVKMDGPMPSDEEIKKVVTLPLVIFGAGVVTCVVFFFFFLGGDLGGQNKHLLNLL